MRKFKFQLQKVLDYRTNLEEEAKKTYLEARVKRLESEIDLDCIGTKRKNVISQYKESLESRLVLETYLMRLDDEEKMQNSIVTILIDEEAVAYGKWIEKCKETKAMQKLHDHKYEDWKYESNRAQQNQLDEFALKKQVMA